jgi:hypothetical protein
MASPDNPTQVKEFIPESWFDLIARMVPGSLILAITLRRYAMQDLNIASLVIGLIAAYAVGFFMEIALSVALKGLPENHYIRGVCTQPFLPLRSPNHEEMDRSEKYIDLWAKMDKSSLVSARQATLKMLAELSMIRTFTFYFILQFGGGLLMQLLQHCCPAMIRFLKLCLPSVFIGIIQKFFFFPWPLSIVVSLYLAYLWMNHYKNVADRIARINH